MHIVKYMFFNLSFKMEIVDNDFKNGFICAFQFALKYGFLLSTCIVRGNMQELYTLSTWFALIKETLG